MATYRGGSVPDYDEGFREHEHLRGRLPGMENVEEELNLPPEAGTDRIRRPGEKGYMKEQHIAGTPTPRIRGGLPPADMRDESEGREVPAPPMQWYERGQDTGQGTTAYRHGPFPSPPTPPPGGRGMTPEEIAKFQGADQALTYQHGGMVEQSGCKHGSSTIITCRNK